MRVGTGLVLILATLTTELRGDEVADLKAQVEQMQQAINGLRARISELEKDRPTPPLPRATAVAPTPDPVPPPPALAGKPVYAPPPTPPMRGYLALPETPFVVRFNFKPRLDMTVDSGNPGDRYRFVTAKLPLAGTLEHAGGGQVFFNSNGSQIDFDIRAPSEPGNFRLYYQNDFFGSDTSDMKYRLREAFGDYYNLRGGFTYSLFVDRNNWPDTLDYEGTNAVEWVRRALIHYRFALNEQWKVTFGIEKPDILVDDNFDSSIVTETRMPDTGMNLIWDGGGRGHVQLSSIFRSIGAKGESVGDQRVFGWGFDASAALNVSSQDVLRAWVVYGEGIGAFGNDSSFENTDAAYDANGRLHALRYVSGMLGYTHRWNDQWRSTLSYGYVNISNTDGQAGDAYHVTHYGSANLIYKLNKQFSIGVEGLYGRREVHDGRFGDDFRLQLSLLYRLFD
ncbi:hypothetical protein CfE428DRAFT_6197 [Chthoniobacter flavus Ellin428]|uniref:Porin n=1 Tax=Chthoniobacter flavus Ellin428 TaxID=497964 RepID=B4DBA6_9BACT|nr:hypothetical protein CfE428DRAFT_6197 [Chthoniobacter flavus Ellin428]TCO84710.1 hypothetical protein EV701_13415 [Chthoniobacter flavus]